MIKFLKISMLFIVLAVVVSCDNGQSLEKYYVDHKENDEFVMVDVPTSLISPKSDKLTSKQKDILKTVKKVNMLAYPLSNGTKEKYESETSKIKTILGDDSYEELMNFGKPGQRMRLYFKGEEDAIDEIIVFAVDDEKGFLLARVLGDNMNVGDMVNFMESMDKEDGSFDTSQFEGVMDIFNQK
tara:strand:- start:1669 stop:2220 length:552 start_codon:yes stop_codon:yes gene_type:complete